MVTALVFYFFAIVLVFAALGVVFSRNPVHAVLFLIMCFFNAAFLFVLLGAEFLAMILAIVYVGAVAVLFLFVVMMLDVNFCQIREGARRYVPLGVLIGGILLAELLAVFLGWESAPAADALRANPVEQMESGLGNTEALGMILYTDYLLPFQLAGLILLVAMMGAIGLNLRRRADVRKQSVADQVARKREDTVEIVKVTPGTGV